MKFNKILVLYKESNYKLQKKEIEAFKAGHSVIDNHKKHLEKEHGRHYRSLDEIADILNEFKLNYHIISRGKKVNYGSYDCVITIGGDGTFLEASRFIESQYLVGINSAPDSSVGKFCLTDAKHFRVHLNNILIGKYKPTRLTKLRGRISVVNNEFYALNDLLICHHNPAAMSRYGIEIDKLKEIHKSSGLWIATPAGSSGGLKSAGGKKMKMNDKGLQYKPRELYLSKNFHYKLRGGILKENQSIKVTSIMKGGRIFVDGAHISFIFPYGTVLTVKKSKKVVKAFIGN